MKFNMFDNFSSLCIKGLKKQDSKFTNVRVQCNDQFIKKPFYLTDTFMLTFKLHV